VSELVGTPDTRGNALEQNLFFYSVSTKVSTLRDDRKMHQMASPLLPGPSSDVGIMSIRTERGPADIASRHEVMILRGNTGACAVFDSGLMYSWRP